MSNYNAIKQNIIQAALIVFSVVLGLYLSERIEERKNKLASANLLAKIKSEVNDNIKIMEEWAPYHQEIKKNLDSLSKDEIFIEKFIKDKSILFRTLLTKNSFMGTFPANDAWDIAKSHPLMVNIDYDIMVVLSKIYGQQERTFEPGFEMFLLVKSKDINERKEVKANLETMTYNMHELVARELQLIDYYNNAKEILGLEGNKSIDN